MVYSVMLIEKKWDIQIKYSKYAYFNVCTKKSKLVFHFQPNVHVMHAIIGNHNFLKQTNKFERIQLETHWSSFLIFSNFEYQISSCERMFRWFAKNL